MNKTLSQFDRRFLDDVAGTLRIIVAWFNEVSLKTPVTSLSPSGQRSAAYARRVLVLVLAFLLITGAPSWFASNANGVHLATASAQDGTVETIINIPEISCTGGGQLCVPPFVSTPVETNGVFKVEYLAPTTHCSPVFVHITVAGRTRTTPTLNPGESSGLLDFGPLDPGDYPITAQAEGVTGGCNIGQIGSWAGTLRVITSPRSRVYITRVDANGTVFKLEELASGRLSTITGLSFPEDILCGPDRRLYVNELFATQAGSTVNRLWRLNQDGRGRTIVAEWNATDLRPSAMVFAANGDLYFGTVSVSAGVPTQGIWRIPGARQANRGFNRPQPVLPVFTPTANNRSGAATIPHAFLTAGPFAGDLLITEDPRFFVSADAGPENHGARVLRALQPDFTSAQEFIPRHVDPETGRRFHPAGFAINSQGDILLNDFENNKVLRYGPDGTFKGIFARVMSPNQIAIGPDDVVYVTNVFSPTGMPVRGRLFVFSPEGHLLGSLEPDLFLRGVTVCAP